MHNTEATAQALNILRRGDQFQWSVIPFLAFVCYVYFTEIKNRNWASVSAGLALYGVHWFYEIVNALIQHATGHALWTVPTGTSFLIFIGVGIEISLMFAVSGIIISRLLPENPSEKIAGFPLKWLHVVSFAVLYSVIEIFLVKATPVFVWVYDWWGAIPVGLTVYVRFFSAGVLAYYWQPRTRLIFISAVWILDLFLVLVFAVVLRWI